MNNKCIKIVSNKEILPQIIWALLCGSVLLNFSYFIIGKSSSIQLGDPGPEFFPQILIWLMLISSIVLVVIETYKAVNQIGIDSAFGSPTGIAPPKAVIIDMNEEGEEGEEPENLWMLLAIIVLAFLYAYLLTKIGFIVGTIVFLMAVQLLLKQPKILFSYIIFPLASVTVLYLFFIKAMGVMYPKGFGIFEQISRIFY